MVGSASRKAEVLKLMAQVLEFDAETQQRVHRLSSLSAQQCHVRTGWVVRKGLDDVVIRIADSDFCRNTGQPIESCFSDMFIVTLFTLEYWRHVGQVSFGKRKT